MKRLTALPLNNLRQANWYPPTGDADCNTDELGRTSASSASCTRTYISKSFCIACASTPRSVAIKAATRAGQLMQTSRSSRASRNTSAAALARSTNSPLRSRSVKRVRCAWAISCAVRACTNVRLPLKGRLVLSASHGLSRPLPQQRGAVFPTLMATTRITGLIPGRIGLGCINCTVTLQGDAALNNRVQNWDVAHAPLPRIAKATAVGNSAMFGCPHRALLRELSAHQRITSDLADSRTSRIGSQLMR